MRKILISLSMLSLASSFSAVSHAHGPTACEQKLSTEFSRVPDDSNAGFVTDQVKLSVESLKAAYGRGIFPWVMAADREHAEFYSPPNRGVLVLSELHISTSDQKYIRQQTNRGILRVTRDQAFEKVIRACAEKERWRTNDQGERVRDTEWITEEIIQAYVDFAKAGHAFSYEVWDGDLLVGGLYGTFVDGAYGGESMFNLADYPNVTKLAAFRLITDLQNAGHTFLDTQQARPGSGLMSKWGAREEDRDTAFLPRLRAEQALKLSR